MSTTLYRLNILLGDKTAYCIGAGQEFTSAVITYPAAAAPYFSIVMTRPDATTVTVEGQNINLVKV